MGLLAMSYTLFLNFLSDINLFSTSLYFAYAASCLKQALPNSFLYNKRVSPVRLNTFMLNKQISVVLNAFQA